jgi:dihydroorotase
MAQTRKTSAAVAKLAPAFDTVVKGGRLIDPKNGIDGIRDIGIRKGRIAAIAPRRSSGPIACTTR